MKLYLWLKLDKPKPVKPSKKRWVGLTTPRYGRYVAGRNLADA
jgi:hypothetical protein